MSFEIKCLKFVVLLVMLISSSFPTLIVENETTDTTEIPETTEAKMIRYRLPNNVIPRLYKIQIEPNMEVVNFTWTGKISIDVEINKPTKTLTLHAYQNLVIYENSTILVNANGSKLTPVQQNRDDEIDFLNLKFNDFISVGNYSLNLEFDGENNDVNGFFKIAETTENALSHRVMDFRFRGLKLFVKLCSMRRVVQILDSKKIDLPSKNPELVLKSNCVAETHNLRPRNLKSITRCDLKVATSENYWILFYSSLVPSKTLKKIGNDSGLCAFCEGPVAATSFEPTLSRRAFPCWDEPGLKAHFRVSIKHFSNYTALSNMPEIDKVETPEGKMLTTFETTPIMSSYLLTFVIATYENVFNEQRNVSLHSPKSLLEEVKHLLEFSPKVVDVMESYTGLSFGFPRIGSVLLPNYPASATEHWGLISYMEDVVRFNATTITTAKKDYGEMVIAHELAHAWFGNRVSPLWWDDIWLNEAFAAYFQHFIMDQIYGNRSYLELFVVRNNQDAFSKDKISKYPVKWTPVTYSEIREVFSSTTYEKGSAIVHMFRNVFGDDVFRSGIQKFLTKYSFKAAVTEDLTNSFQEAYDMSQDKNVSLNVKETINSWLVQRGYPMINVTRNYTTGESEVSQRSTIIGDNSTKWWIPLTYATKSEPNFTSTLPLSWITDKEDSVKINGIDKDDWIIMNIRASGYYRINYDDENWNRLADYLNSDNYVNIHPLNRAQLISDAFYLATNEPNRYYQNFYKLTKYLARETEYLPWQSAYKAIERIQHRLRYTRAQKSFELYVMELMNNFIEKFGVEPCETDDHFKKLSKLNVIMWPCMNGHEKCLRYASQEIIKIAENPVEKQVHPDTKHWIYCAGLRGLNDTAAVKFSDWAIENNRNMLINNIGCTENHKVHRNLLNFSLQHNGTKILRVFDNLLSSTDENFNFAVDFFVDNYQAINNTVGSNDSPYKATSLVLDTSSHRVKSRAQLEKMKIVLLLDAVDEDTKMENEELLLAVEGQIAEGDAAATIFFQLLDNKSL